MELKDFNGVKIQGTRGNLVPTSNQMKTIRLFVYNYKITIKDTREMRTRAGVSKKISEIYNAIKEGKIQERKSRPTNCKVKLIGDTWKLVQDRPTLDDEVYQNNGFARFIEQENEREQARFMVQHKQWLAKQKQRA